MPTDLHKQLTSQSQPMQNEFIGMMQRFRGQNPRDIINQMVQSGHWSQQQLNAAQQRMQQVGSMFDPLKSKFGF